MARAEASSVRSIGRCLRLVAAVTVLPVLFLAFFALDSYALILVGGFFLGIGQPLTMSWLSAQAPRPPQ